MREGKDALAGFGRKFAWYMGINVAVGVALLGALAYVACHFIAKAW